MAKLDLRPEWLEIVLRLITQHVSDAEVLAYGSRVNMMAVIWIWHYGILMIHQNRYQV